MSWSARARELFNQGYSESEAYAIVAAERRAVDVAERSEAHKVLCPSPDYIAVYREAQEEGEAA